MCEKNKCGQVIWINKEAMTIACGQNMHNPWETGRPCFEMLEELGLFICLNKMNYKKIRKILWEA